MKILIMAAGTGGHIIPALTVADRLTHESHEVHWLGTSQGLEQQLVKTYPLHAISASGVRGKSVIPMLRATKNMLKAYFQAEKIIKKIQPEVVVGFGGYVCLPGGLAAKRNRIPLVIHEQNAVPGLTNRWLAKMAEKTCQAFPGSFKRAITTGNPVRADIQSIAALEQIHLPLKILIIGGSQGAKIFNEKIPEILAKFDKGQFNIWHIAGSKHQEQTTDVYRQLHLTAKISGFEQEMQQAYAWADLVIARSGALTVSETAASGRPAIFIPLPHAVDDHQFYNAKYLADQGAAFIIRQNEMDQKKFIDLIQFLLINPQKLVEISQKLKKIVMKDAGEKITATVLNAVN